MGRTGGALGFLLRVAGGALALGVVGYFADVLGGTEGWWFWGLCAGAIVGALASYLGRDEWPR